MGFFEPGELTVAQAIALHERYGSAKAAVFALRDKKAAEKPARKAAEKPARKAAEKPARKAAEKPARKAAEKPARKAAEKAARKAAERAARDAKVRLRYETWLEYESAADAAKALGVGETTVLAAVRECREGPLPGASPDLSWLTREAAEHLVEEHGTIRRAAAAAGCSMATIRRRTGRSA